MSKLLILLTGEEGSLPAAEAVATIRTYDKRASFRFPSRRIVLAETSAPSEPIMKRIAYAKVVGKVIEDIEGVMNFLKGKRIRWRCYTVDGGGTALPAWIEKIDAKVSLDDPEYEIATVVSGEKYDVLTIPSLMKKSWSSRRPRVRSFFHPSAIYPKLARALVNLTECMEGSTLLDPFAGTGSILIEASIVGIEPVGIDISRKMGLGMKMNMEFFGQDWLSVIIADSRRLPIRMVDGIVTDVPYGRASKTYFSDTESLTALLLEQAREILAAGKKIVIMHPSGTKVKCDGFSVEERHYIPVHRNLTREITVMRRLGV